MSKYKNFSKQDLLDRRNALKEEWMDDFKRSKEILTEIGNINKLLEEKK